MVRESGRTDPVVVPFIDRHPAAPPVPRAQPQSPAKRRRGPLPVRLVTALVTALLLLTVGSYTTLGATIYTPKCDDVNLRSGKSTSFSKVTRVDRGDQLTVVKTVSGGSYGAYCKGRWRYGSAWHKISAINGRSVASLYGVSYVFGASKLFKSVTTTTTTATATPSPSPTPSPTPAPTPTPSPTPAPTATPTPTTTMAAKCDAVNLRKGPSTTYAIKTSVAQDTPITVVSTVSGGSWSTSCAGKSLSGSSWHRISAIDGRSVSSLYGVSYVYGASGLFYTVATATPTPTPTAEPTPSPEPTASPSPDASPSPSPSADPSPSPDPSPTPSPSPTGPIALPAEITFYGRGWGHGVGMSQYGAYGRALAGESAGEILAHYYQDTTMGSIGNPSVRVRVLAGFVASSSNPVQVFGRGGSWSIDGIAKTFPADARLRMIPTTSGDTTTWRAVVNDASGKILHDAAVPRKIMVRPGSGTTLQLWSKPSAYDRYRGSLRIIGKSGSTSKVKVVNHLRMEDYLRGVVPAEVSAAWPTEAIRAQAIAARSYAARRLHPSTGSFDLYDSTRHQVYRGVLAEKSGTDAAISATAGKVRLTSSGAVANTLFHSTGGGATEHNENVFVSSSGAIVSSPVKYLRGSLDRRADGSAYDDASNLATWKTNTYSLAQLQAWFASDSRTNVGTLVALDLRDRGVSGRLISVTLNGASGTTKKVSGAVFIAVFNANRPSGDRTLRSTLFDLAPIP